eukprot:Pgem_evm1s6970
MSASTSNKKRRHNSHSSDDEALLTQAAITAEQAALTEKNNSFIHSVINDSGHLFKDVTDIINKHYKQKINISQKLYKAKNNKTLLLEHKNNSTAPNSINTKMELTLPSSLSTLKKSKDSGDSLNEEEENLIKTWDNLFNTFNNNKKNFIMEQLQILIDNKDCEIDALQLQYNNIDIMLETELSSGQLKSS